MLIEHGAHVDIQNYQGATALIYAATFGRAEVAELLLAYGANAAITDQSGNTALMHAQMQGNKSMIDLLSI
jgi:hypothetical protein